MNKNDSHHKLDKAENLAFDITVLKRKCGSLSVNKITIHFGQKSFSNTEVVEHCPFSVCSTGSISPGHLTCDQNTPFTVVRRGITLTQTKQRVTVPSADLSPVQWAVNCTDTWSQS